MMSPSAPAAMPAVQLRRHNRVARGMAWIKDHRQMRQMFQNRNGIDIGRVARGSFKGADAALAQHHALVTPRQNIFGRHQQFFDGRGKSAFEQDSGACFANGTQQIEVLHVARADLKHIHIFDHHIHLHLRHDLNDDWQSRFLALGKSSRPSSPSP